MGSRRKGREAALRILYFMDVSGVSGTQAIKSYWGHLASEEERTEDVDFANRLVRAYADRQDEVNDLIRSSSHHWRLERMPIVDRNVLRVAIVELRELNDIPKRVTLNEAVELAKRFGSEGSGSFVNGVLDRIATELGKP
ncbi:MAG TPA: transcription antitermination factor NusB [Polyangiales bacterium]|jgi:N utilization substance protein B|nr:transcription antitermination factor NusB [Polyangiales bacterium]